MKQGNPFVLGKEGMMTHVDGETGPGAGGGPAAPPHPSSAAFKPLPFPTHSVPSECPESVRILMLECLETRPSRRPSALQIVERLVAGGGDPQEAGPAAPGSVGPQGQLRRVASGSEVAPSGAPPLPPRAWLSQSTARDLRSAGAESSSRPTESDPSATGNSVHSV